MPNLDKNSYKNKVIKSSDISKLLNETHLNKEKSGVANALKEIEEARKSQYLIIAVKKLINISEKYQDPTVDNCVVAVIKDRIKGDQVRGSKETLKKISTIIQDARQGEISRDVAFKKIKNAISQLDNSQKTKIDELLKFVGNFLLNNNSYAFEMAEKIWHSLQEEKQKENVFKGMNDELFRKNLNFLFDENRIL